MSSRSRSYRGRSKNGVLPWIILGSAAFTAAVLFLGSILGNSDACGDRGIDEEKSGYCLVSSDDYKHIVIVTGNTQNSSAPNLDFSEDGNEKELLAGAFYSSGSIEIISTAGEGNNRIEFKGFSPAKNISASNNNLKKLGRSINEAIKTKPTQSGSNYMGAIWEAAQHLNAIGDDSKKLIIVVGSGYSDSGILDFAHDDLLNKASDIDTIIRNDERLEEGIMSGISLRWYNMNGVVAPQDSLSDYSTRIRTIYEKALGYAGVMDMNLRLGDTEPRPSVADDTNFTVERVYAGRLKSGDDIMINENVAKFENDKDILTNPAEVKRYMQSFVEKLQPNQKIDITGYIDHCIDGYDLGLRRAKAIRSLLVEMGISGDRIGVYGEYGPPPKDYSSQYVCKDNPEIPDIEQRTVRIVVK